MVHNLVRTDKSENRTRANIKQFTVNTFNACLTLFCIFLLRIACYLSGFYANGPKMSRNIRISRLGQAPGLGESTLGRNRKIETLAKTTTTKALLAIVLICSGQSAWSYTVSGNTYTTNGTQSDVQQACNAAPDNGTVTVVIPTGTFSWTGTLTITTSLTLTGTNPGQPGNTAAESAFPTVIQNNTPVGSNMINCTSGKNGHTIIEYICFQQVSSNGQDGSYCIALDRSDCTNPGTAQAALVNNPYTCLLHDCYLDAGSINNYMVLCQANGIVIWNCTLTGNSGFQLVCGKYYYTASWNSPDTYGMEDTTGLGNTYIEDCYIAPNAYGASQYAMNADDNSRIVFRNSVFQDTALGSHGQESSPIGVRCWEVYNNTFNLTTGNPQNVQCWFTDRGGAGVWWGNTMGPISTYNKASIIFCVFSTNEYTGYTGTQTAWPAARQVGQGWSASSSNTYGNPTVPLDGTGEITSGIWVWNNTQTGAGALEFGAEASNSSTFVQEGRDYFLSAKPSYTPYTYPHPLHTAYAAGSPAPTPNATPLAPQNLRVN